MRIPTISERTAYATVYGDALLLEWFLPCECGGGGRNSWLFRRRVAHQVGPGGVGEDGVAYECEDCGAVVTGCDAIGEVA